MENQINNQELYAIYEEEKRKMINEIQQDYSDNRDNLDLLFELLSHIGKDEYESYYYDKFNDEEYYQNK